MKCGGSDGFSGISGNPAMGLVSDWLTTLGGASGLAEFPELCGAEGDMVKRCINLEDKKKVPQSNARLRKDSELFRYHHCG